MAEAVRKRAAKKKQRAARRLRKARDLPKKPPPSIDNMNKMQLTGQRNIKFRAMVSSQTKRLLVHGANYNE
ncbi:hypothetical protein EC968_007924, partial [Mortierella alpina]